MFARPFVTRTGQVPAGGFNADHELFDTRIPPRQTDRSRYHFALPGDGAVRVKARLIYRWAYKPLADRKGWKMPDLPMTEKEIALNVTP